MKNKLTALILTVFMINTAVASDLIFKSGFEVGASFELPIVVAAGNTTSNVFKNITVDLEPDLVSSAKYIHLAVHNLQRLPNDDAMAFLRITSSNGVSTPIYLNNKTGVNSGVVVISEQAAAYGGIGGGFSVLTMRIDVENLKKANGERLFLTAENTFRFILLNKAYAEGASAYRVTWLTVSNGSGSSILAGGSPAHYQPGNAADAADYIASDTGVNRSAGENLWNNKTLIARPGEGNIIAKCMDCHTRTGYDLKYFGYSNESIYKRSRFHGFDDDEAKKLALYIRTLDTPSHGRPWNPPYQPGEKHGQPLSSLPVEQWAAGAGSAGVLEHDKDMLGYIFPDTNNNGAIDQADVDDAFQLSQVNPGAPYLGLNLIDIPMHLQLLDWNRWLPRVHPVDIWDDFKNVTSGGLDPYSAYLDLVEVIENNTRSPTNQELNQLHWRIWNFLREGTNKSYRVGGNRGVVRTGSLVNVFRDASEDSDEDGRMNENVLANSSAPYSNDMFDEYAKRAITHWEAVKYFEIFHVGKLEDKMATILYDPEITSEWGWALRTATVFNSAPHKTARNGMYWEGRTNSYNSENPSELDADDQSPLVGVYTSVAWYQLEALLNSGHKQDIPVSNAVDWAYNYSHLELLDEYSGQSQAMLYAMTMIKNWQVRDIMAYDNVYGTRPGLGLRTINPIVAFGTVRRGVTIGLDEYSPDLYKYFLTTAVRRWMQVVKHPDFEYMYSNNNALNRLDQWPRDPDEGRTWSLLPEKWYMPSEWNGGIAHLNSRNLADSFWRLLPLLDQVEVDRDLLTELKDWSQTAWPGPAGNPNDWDSRLANLGWSLTHVKKDRAYRFENTEYPGLYIRATGGAGSLVDTSSTLDQRSAWRARSAGGQWIYLNQIAGDESTRLYDRPNTALLGTVMSDSETGDDVMWRALSLGGGKVLLQAKDNKYGRLRSINAPDGGGNLRLGFFEWDLAIYPPSQRIWQLVDTGGIDLIFTDGFE